MKYLASLFFIFFLFHNANAGNLCDESCDLSISFSEGGSIEALEALTFTFGDSGVVNDGVVVTGYSAGNTLSLTAGESIDFQSGGAIDLGVDGNLDYTNISIANGNITLAANGGAEVVTIYNLSLTGESALNLNSDVTVLEDAVLNLSGTNVMFNLSEGVTLSGLGTININGGVTLTGPGTVWVNTINWPDSDDCNGSTNNGSITISGSATAIVENTSCAGNLISSNPIIFSPLETAILEFTPATITSGTVLTNSPQPFIVIADITDLVEPLTQGFLSLFPDGVELDTDDSQTCFTAEGKCLSATGAEYVVVDGKLVLVKTDGSGGSSSNGAIGWFFYLMLLSLVFFRKTIAI